MHLSLRHSLCVYVVAAFAVVFSATAGEVPAGRVDVILWFDTEDYLLRADDDAAKRLAEMLTARNIRATFKLVGEKARVLERRGRADVIAALAKHDIGYHSDFHSVHPTPSEYLAECGLLDGTAEFARREGKGAADVRRIFGLATLACYGQPGSSWGSQAICALKQIGVAPHGTPCYVDEGTHIGLNEQPFWYCGALNVYHMGSNYTRMELHDPAAVEPAKEKVTQIAARLRSAGGGLISIFYHPCEWVHREFWDGVNFKRGANPPRALWRAPPQRTEEETNAAFERFGNYIDHIRALPGIHFVTASDLPELYPDQSALRGFEKDELSEVARRVRAQKNAGDYMLVDERALSLADQFELLAAALADDYGLNGRRSFPLKTTGLGGPDAAPPPHTELTQLAEVDFVEALKDTLNFIATQHRVPARVFIGATPIPPEDFLQALASARGQFPKTGNGSTSIQLGPVDLLPAKHVAEDTPKLFGGWVIHRENFRAPKILEVARWQTWTLKPALRTKN